MEEIAEYSYVCFIDILGYRHHLDLDRKSGTMEFKTKLSDSMSILDTIDEGIFSVQAISDTVILSCPRHDKFIEFLKLIRNVFLKFLDNGLLIRGGVAYSRHFRSKNITYSHALALAYENESKQAIYPRIVMDKELMAMYLSTETLMPITGTKLLCQLNGVMFLNIISSEAEWALVYEKARSIFLKDQPILKNDETAFYKHLWFQEYIFSSPNRKMSEKRYIPEFKQV